MPGATIKLDFFFKFISPFFVCFNTFLYNFCFFSLSSLNGQCVLTIIIYFSIGIEASIILGDINQDSVIDILDVVLIINFILYQEDPSIAEEIASDLNSDGIINIQDVILIINIILI